MRYSQIKPYLEMISSSTFLNQFGPKKALIIGGVGSRSFLHADPYEWTGWNYCFEGAKLWTFFPPETGSDDGGNFFKTRRSQTTAWGEYNIAAGWQSDVDLYHRVLGADDKEGFASPLNKHWERVYAAEAERGEKMMRPPKFASSDPIMEAAEDLWPLDVENMDMGGGDEEMEDVPSLVHGAVQIVQQPGELVVIPPGWLHQVYSLTPSVAVSGQYFNENNKEKVVRHTIDWCNLIGKEEEEAREREREQSKKKKRRRESRGEYTTTSDVDDEDADLLGEFYEEGEGSGEGTGKAVEEAGLEGDVEVPDSLLAESDSSEMVPSLIRLALLARYRREGVAQEVFEEIYLDSSEE